MLSISNSAIKKLRIIAKEIGVDGYKNMLKQHLENTLTKPFPSILTISSMQPDFKLPPKIKSIFNGSYIEYKKSHQSQNSLKNLDYTCLIF